MLQKSSYVMKANILLIIYFLMFKFQIHWSFWGFFFFAMNWGTNFIFFKWSPNKPQELTQSDCFLSSSIHNAS